MPTEPAGTHGHSQLRPSLSCKPSSGEALNPILEWENPAVKIWDGLGHVPSIRQSCCTGHLPKPPPFSICNSIGLWGHCT